MLPPAFAYFLPIIPGFFSTVASVPQNFPHDQGPALPYLPTNLVPLSQVRFCSRVVAAEYVSAEPEGAADRWERWNGCGDGSGAWRLTVGHRGAGEQEPETEEVHEFDFLILCIGSFSGVPNIPAVSPGPEAFRGRVLHSMELSHMADEDAAALVKGKRVAVVGSGKSAFEIAAECADANGVGTPCTMVCRNPQWLLHRAEVWGGVSIGYLYSWK